MNRDVDFIAEIEAESSSEQPRSEQPRKKGRESIDFYVNPSPSKSNEHFKSISSC